METFDVAIVGLGALGSATAYQLARRDVRVVGFEQFELGHARGASHDTSRIVRTSYGAPQYVRLARSAYRDWADFESVIGEPLVTTTGGLVFLPTDGPFAAADFADSLAHERVAYEQLSPAEVHARWPQFRLPERVDTIYTADSGIAHAARSVTAFQLQARARGAVLRENTAVTRLVPSADGVVVHTSAGSVRARRVVLTADAWTNALLAPLGAEIPLITMQEQVTYFRPPEPARFARERFPVWIWESDLCFYGFPTYGEPTIKAARDRSDNLMTPEERTFVPSADLLAQLTEFLGDVIPGSGAPLRTITCQYAVTPNRNFVLGPLEQHPDIIVGLGAGHAFKFAPAIGRVLAELATTGESTDDISTFAVGAAAAPDGGVDPRPVVLEGGAR